MLAGRPTKVCQAVKTIANGLLVGRQCEWAGRGMWATESLANCRRRRRLLPGRRNLPLTFGSWSLDFVQLDGKSWGSESQLQPPAYLNYNKTTETTTANSTQQRRTPESGKQLGQVVN